MKIVLATRNTGKVAEMKALLEELPVELVSAADVPDAPDVDEDAETLEENARKKAEALHRHAGLPALADDTGLEVRALGGRPGVRSARFAGDVADDAANRRLLLEKLAGEAARDARFRTVIAFVDGYVCESFEGICRGTVIDTERGSGGFGYDPIFVPEGQSETFAELTPEEKNRISHRGRALRAFTAYLRSRLAETTP